MMSANSAAAPAPTSVWGGGNEPAAGPSGPAPTSGWGGGNASAAAGPSGPAPTSGWGAYSAAGPSGPAPAPSAQGFVSKTAAPAPAPGLGGNAPAAAGPSGPAPTSGWTAGPVPTNLSFGRGLPPKTTNGFGWGGSSGFSGGRWGQRAYTEEQIRALGDFPDLSKISNDTVACLRAISGLKNKGLITSEVNDYLRYALVCNIRSIVVPISNSINAFGMPDFFSLDDLADAVNRVYDVATGRYTITLAECMGRTSGWSCSVQPRFGTKIVEPPSLPQQQPQQQEEKQHDDTSSADTTTWD